MDFSEFVREFEEDFGQDYEYEIDEAAECIYLCSKPSQLLLFGTVRIEYESDRFSIYKEFVYEDYLSKFRTYLINKEELVFREALKQIAKDAVQDSCEDGMGCPYIANQVGFFEIPFSREELAAKIQLIELALDSMAGIPINGINQDSCERAIFREAAKELFDELKDLSPNLCITPIKDTSANKNHQFDNTLAYVNNRGTIVTGIGHESLATLCPNREESRCLVYSGINYFIISEAEDLSNTLVIDKKLVDEVVALFEKTCGDWEFDPSFDFTIGSNNQIVITFDELWAVVYSLQRNMYETYFTFEKNALRKLEHDYLQIAPKNIWNREYDFSVLTDEQFESMCRDILQSMGFQDVKIRGKTHAPDGGVDIVAQEEFRSLIGSEKRKWIIQCKHMKGQVNRKDISEVRDLLNEFNADCYGLFYSGYFSPSTLDRIEAIRNKDRITIKVWDCNDLEVMLSQHTSVSLKYFGL